MKKTNRIEVRIDQTLFKCLAEFCTKNNISQSDVVRTALQNYLVGDLKQILFRIPGNENLYRAFMNFLEQSPIKVKHYFENLVGQDEEDLINSIPQRTLGSLSTMKFITKRGEDAFKKKLKSL